VTVLYDGIRHDSRPIIIYHLFPKFMMVRKEIIGGAVAAIIIIFVVLVLPSEDVMDSEVVVKETKIAVKPTDIADLSAVQFGNELSLSMSLGDIIPESLDDIPLSENAIGFGYGWFEVTKTIEEHSIKGGPGHMRAYLVNKYIDDTGSSAWKLETANVDIIALVDYHVDFCLRTFDTVAEMVLANKTITVKTPPDTTPRMNAFYVDRAASFELVPDNRYCHQEQMGATIIDLLKLE